MDKETLLKNLIILYRQLIEKLTPGPRYKVKGIIVHHSASMTASLMQVNEEHKNRWGSISSLGYYVGYHRVIDKNGVVSMTRLDGEEGIHAKGYNKGYIGICLLGNFQIELPTDEQLNALKSELISICDTYGLSRNTIKGHRDVSNTLCPGNSIYQWLQQFKNYEL